MKYTLGSTYTYIDVFLLCYYILYYMALLEMLWKKNKNSHEIAREAYILVYLYSTQEPSIIKYYIKYIFSFYVYWKLFSNTFNKML